MDEKKRNYSRRQVLAGGSAVALSAVGERSARAAGKTKRPNFIFILADDLGYADLSAFGQTDYQTPHLDRLAAQGVKLTHAYANSAVCSATRFALITGRYQYRLRGGLEEAIAQASKTNGLPPEHPTLPSLLKKAGYSTALFGKWHLGSLPTFGPLKSGYDKFFGNYGGAIDYFSHRRGAGAAAEPDLYEGEVPVEKVGYYTDLIAEHATQYLGERAKKRDEPFLLSLHFTAPHWPWEGPKDQEVSKQLKDFFHYDGGSQATYADIVRALDAAIGRVLAALDAAGLADNTFVVFTSDNGGERFSRTWPFSGQKTELLEGGIRVPTIARFPQRIPAGKVSTQVAISMDWLPTFLEAAGVAPDASYAPDGVSLLGTLSGKQPEFERTLFWRYKSHAQRAVRSGRFKYLKIANNEFLFDLLADPRERANLAQKNPEIFKTLKARFDEWNAKMLPLAADSYTHAIDASHQADHYAP